MNTRQKKTVRKGGFLLLKGETWPYDIVVCLGITRDELLSYMQKRFIDPLTDRDKRYLKMSGHGLTVRLENKAIVLWLIKYPTSSEGFAYLAHEIFHTADMMLRNAGMILSDESDEAWAYQIDWITKRIYKEFNFK